MTRATQLLVPAGILGLPPLPLALEFGLDAYLVAVVVLAGTVPVALNVWLMDRSIPVRSDLFPPGAERRLLAIFPHPDDELLVAGTVSLLRRTPDTHITIAHLTRGEGGWSREHPTPEELGRARVAEGRAAAEVLGAEHVALDFADGALDRTDPDALKASIRELIRQHRPTVLVTFDDDVGLYGHADHVTASRCVRAVFRESVGDPDFLVRRVYAVTLPKRMVDLALRVSGTFRRSYHQHSRAGLPTPTDAVKLNGESDVKMAVAGVHRTQRHVLRDIQPLFDAMPIWCYYRIFDREYFSLCESR